jgi:soluble lytic murein transglycosylase
MNNRPILAAPFIAHRWLRRLSFLFLTGLLLAGCGDSAPTPEPSPTPRPVPTWTPTPAAQAVSTPAAVESAAISPVSAEITTTDTSTGTNAASAGEAPLVAAEAVAPSADDRLAEAQLLHRYGDTGPSRILFNQLLNDPATAPALRLDALYGMARSYLYDELYAEALRALDELDATLAQAAEPGEIGPEARFLRARALAGLARYGEAIAAYQQYLTVLPWMAEFVAPRIAQAALAAGDSELALATQRQAADAVPDSDPITKVGLLEVLAQNYARQERYAEAVAVYDEILALARNGGYRAEVQYLAGQALSAAGDGAGAIARWQAATGESPEAPSAYLALVELVNRQVDFDLYLRGYIDLMAEAYLPAISAYQAFLDQVGPSDERAGLALHQLGQAQLGAGDLPAALAAFERVISEYPACACTGQAWLDKAYVQILLGDTAGARRTYRTFARELSGDPLAAEALWLSGRQALDDGNTLEAATDMLALADSFPASERAPLALYVLGVGAYENRLYTQSIEVFARLQGAYPDFRWDAVAFWLGRAQAGAGQQAAADATWQALVERAPDIYYGIMAHYLLRDQPLTGGASLVQMAQVAGPAGRLAGDDGGRAFAESWLAEWLDVPAAELGVLPPEIAENQNLAKGRLLLAMDERGDALVALQRLYDAYADEPRYLYPLSLALAEAGEYRLSIIAMARLLQFSPAGLVENAPIFLQRYAYPRYFREGVEREATAYGIDPLLYFSLIRQESLFEEGARSTAAAQGLAQIIPDTARWVAGQLGLPESEATRIYRPSVNLHFGAYYLDWARAYLDDNLLLALIGYNAGPGNADSWQDLYGPDDSMIVERMPFSEPRAYITLITGNLYHYTRLYATP